jgi:hypothetical protein
VELIEPIRLTPEQIEERVYKEVVGRGIIIYTKWDYNGLIILGG